MSLSSFISDFYSSLTVSSVQAEAPPAEEAESQPKGESTEEKEKEEEIEAEEGPDKREGEGKEEEREEEEKEEEEEDDEPKDPAPAILEECFDINECKPYKHHYDECVERVTSATSEDGPKEDCVEEFFHILHCANTCAAPKIWSKLK